MWLFESGCLSCRGGTGLGWGFGVGKGKKPKNRFAGGLGVGKSAEVRNRKEGIRRDGMGDGAQYEYPWSFICKFLNSCVLLLFFSVPPFLNSSNSNSSGIIHDSFSRGFIDPSICPSARLPVRLCAYVQCITFSFSFSFSSSWNESNDNRAS